ncbi:MAG: DNA polymerase III subunit delta, partial [Clostridia bacterium]
NLPEYNLVVIDGEKATVSDISDAMNAPPYMSDFKAVIVNNLPLDQKNKDNLDDIANIACQLNEGTALIFNFRPFTIDIKGLSAKNSKLLYAQFFKSVSEIGLCVCFSPESGEKLNSWVAKHFESEKIKIQKSAIAFLPAYCGSDMYILNGEIEKLSSYYSGETLTEKDIESVCCPNETFQTFDLCNALIEKNAVKLKKVFDNLCFLKVLPEFILGALSKTFCDMYMIKSMYSDGKDFSAIRAASKMQDWMLKRAINSATKTDIAFIEYAVSECSKTDLMLKSFSGNSYLIIEIFLYGVLNYGKRKA